MNYTETIQKAADAPLRDSTFQMTPSGLMNLRTMVTKWNVPADFIVLSDSVRKKLFKEEWFPKLVTVSDSISGLEQGYIGSMLGMGILTDFKYLLGHDDLIVVVSVKGLADGAPEDRCVFKAKVAST